MRSITISATAGGDEVLPSSKLHTRTYRPHNDCACSCILLACTLRPYVNRIAPTMALRTTPASNGRIVRCAESLEGIRLDDDACSHVQYCSSPHSPAVSKARSRPIYSFKPSATNRANPQTSSWISAEGSRRGRASISLLWLAYPRS